MTEIKIIFRCNLSEVAFPAIEEFIKSDKELNIISSNRIRNDFLKSKNALAEKINFFFNQGELIPIEYLRLFWTAMIIEDKLNIFTTMIGAFNHFEEFEKCMESKNYVISEIIYLKISDTQNVVEIAKQKYPKIYDDSEILQKHIEEYNVAVELIMNYIQSKYKLTIIDFFSNEIEI